MKTEFLKTRTFNRLIFSLVMVALVVMWGVVTRFSLAEQDYALERARSQLELTVLTLADFNELARRAEGAADGDEADERTAAIWRALLRYPAANIWVEEEGHILGGQPYQGEISAAILVEEARRNFTVYAALPRASALADWKGAVVRRFILLAAGSVAFLVLTYFLLRALRLRTLAERDAAMVEERNKQLAIHRAQLEDTVAQRTEELKQSNTRLGQELSDREAAEAALREHDALLHSVTKSAGELLGSHSHEDAISLVLELIAQTIGVSRVQINEIDTSQGGHLCASVRYEWCAPGLKPMIDDPAFQNINLNKQFPGSTVPLLVGETADLWIEQASDDFRAQMERANMRSVLQIPLKLEDKLWGSLNFIDSGETRREWTWAETDTLQTLADLIGAAKTRARYMKELADANMIVQNSPTILYRLRGEPSFPLIYISHNIIKFGHDPNELVGKRDWMKSLVSQEDQQKLVDAMTQMLTHDGKGASIEFRLRTGEGTYRWVENRYTPVHDKDGRLIEVEGIIIDITERKAAEEKIAAMARTDGLTGLANRATFIERLRQSFAAAKRGGHAFAIFYLDLDQFKRINDTLGHPVGDDLLRQVGERLKEGTRESDLVARLGGDEFAVLQTEMGEPANAGTLANKLLKEMRRPYMAAGNELHVTASIGISPYTEESVGPDSMLSQADLALYRAKEEGRDCYRFHSDDLDAQVLERTTLADDLRKAIEQDELELLYQPQVQLKTGKVIGVEALVRWNHPARGILRPNDFLPVAEKTGAIVPLGRWVLDTACGQMRAWKDAGVAPPEITLNLAAAQLKNGREFVRDVSDMTAKWGLHPSDLRFDITEAVLAQATWTHNDVLSQLRQLGAKIAIDDFGTEYSSFDYLRAYKVNTLKIAPDFIAKCAKDAELAAVVRAMMHLAAELKIDVIAEGVETKDQMEWLLSTGNDSTYAQGFYFSEAVPAEDAYEFLQKGRVDPAKVRRKRPSTRKKEPSMADAGEKQR